MIKGRVKSRLLNRISLLYMAASVVIFLTGGIVFYNLIGRIFQRQLDNNLREEQMLIEQTINFSDSVPDFRLVFGHMIDVTILNIPQPESSYIHDTLMYDLDNGVFKSYRHLFAQNTSLHGKGYLINLYRTLDETEELVGEILIAVSLIFISLLMVLIVVNYIAARKVWIPFYRMLHTLKRYRIDHAGPLDLPGTSLHEFEQLREALLAMSEKIRDDYRLMKEFNENAAHELQTPVAVIQSKLEMLMQDENLPETMVLQLNAAMEAASRMSRMIQGLLLISRIGNNQYNLTEPTDVGILTGKILDRYNEMIDFRGITVIRNLEPGVILSLNPTLGDILVTNLVSNAIRYNLAGGTIRVTVNSSGLTIANPGKPPRTAPGSMFARFTRAGNDPDSSGLGLSIVKTIADLYNMTVEYTYQNEMHIVTLHF